jgi:hypothetical protein
MIEGMVNVTGHESHVKTNLIQNNKSTYIKDKY